MDQQNYDNFDVEDLLANESFQSYCRKDDPATISFWHNIVTEKPWLKEKISSAEFLFRILSGNQGGLESEKARLMSRIEVQAPVRRMSRWWWAAAAIVIIGSFSTWFLAVNNNDKPLSIAKEEVILPGTDKAYLTLGDGSRILLDSLQTRDLGMQGGASLMQKNSIVSYTTNLPLSRVEYNTITTPLGGQFQVVLSDGSHVWLNSGSSLKYPTSFQGHERRVEMTGEGYFEVARNKEKPFIVSAWGTDITVLGTSFNVNAYRDDDEIRTTLISGSVVVSKDDKKVTIKPGEQAIAQDAGNLYINKKADLEVAVAWKNGKFIFHGEKIRAVIRQLERWYNIEAAYEPGLTDDEFVGVISRYASLTDVLNMLEKTETVRFEISGKKITVVPYKNKLK